jgi:peptidyl-prolyl cis-trans isomerase-like protein 2
MVKRQKEKQYLSARESRSYQTLRSGAHPGATTTSGHTRPLPFHVCALSLNPYQHPVATPSGVVFESSVIIPHLLRTGLDPVSGRPLATKDLVTLHMDRSGEEGRWQCPVLEKPFTDRTKVVAIRQNPPGNEANVYSYEAVNELNFKPRNYEDLTSGKKVRMLCMYVCMLDACMHACMYVCMYACIRACIDETGKRVLHFLFLVKYASMLLRCI